VRGFNAIKLDRQKLEDELGDLESLLNSSTELKERAQIAPFFKQHQHLVAGLGYFNSAIALPDRVSTELDIFGDFACDAASGDSVSKSFLLVEFEDANEFSILGKADPGKNKPWSSRFEHGFSQLVDWAWRLNQEGGTSDAFTRIFDVSHPSIHFLLIVGRDADLDARDKSRMHWRANSINLGPYRLSCLTFDGVLTGLRRRLELSRG
jgi:hypothetical protein